MKRFFSLFILTLFALSGCGGGGGGDDSPSLTSISVTPANNKLPTGISQQYTATGNYSNGTTQNLTSSVTWSSSNNSVAKINAAGLVTTDADGTTTIAATTNGISGATTLEVEGIDVPPGDGDNLDLTGTWTGTYTIIEFEDPNTPVPDGPYTYKLELVQTGTTVTGTATLRYSDPNPLNWGVSFQFAGTVSGGTVTGDKLDFRFSYLAPWDANKRVNEDIGAGRATDDTAGSTMTGQVIENYSGGYILKYDFVLTKQ